VKLNSTNNLISGVLSSDSFDYLLLFNLVGKQSVQNIKLDDNTFHNATHELKSLGWTGMLQKLHKDSASDIFIQTNLEYLYAFVRGRKVKSVKIKP
jgi:hypothetical protein